MSGRYFLVFVSLFVSTHTEAANRSCGMFAVSLSPRAVSAESAQFSPKRPPVLVVTKEISQILGGQQSSKKGGRFSIYFQVTYLGIPGTGSAERDIRSALQGVNRGLLGKGLAPLRLKNIVEIPALPVGQAQIFEPYRAWVNITITRGALTEFLQWAQHSNRSLRVIWVGTEILENVIPANR